MNWLYKIISLVLIVSSSICFAFSPCLSLLISSRDNKNNFVINAEKLQYGGLNHCGVLVSNTELSKQFYINAFGFIDESHLRPTMLPYPGAFLRCGSSQIHLMELPNPDPISNRPTHAGRDRHVALTINDLDILKSRLDNLNIPYTFSQSGRRALFCRDLDSNGYEFMEDTAL
eukprot:gene6673-9155_t